MFFNRLTSGTVSSAEGWLVALSLLVCLGVWLIPAILPAVYEFRRSASVRLSVFSVIAVWVSAVVGYYVNYLIMLAFVGLPNMEFLVFFGGRTSDFWQAWGQWFPRLILFNLLKWTVVGAAISGIAGMITSTVLSRRMHKVATA